MTTYLVTTIDGIFRSTDERDAHMTAAIETEQETVDSPVLVQMWTRRVQSRSHVAVGASVAVTGRWQLAVAVAGTGTGTGALV